jgi:HPt (histidine-containing phosphotransfer) domain-containing protein
MPAAQQPVDMSHLNRYTGGERQINEEVLRLFEETSAKMLAQLEALLAQPASVPLPKAWKETAHTLKGAARGIGAFDFAAAAADAEANGDNRPRAIEALERMKLHSQAVYSFIEEFLGRRA